MPTVIGSACEQQVTTVSSSVKPPAVPTGSAAFAKGRFRNQARPSHKNTKTCMLDSYRDARTTAADTAAFSERADWNLKLAGHLSRGMQYAVYEKILPVNRSVLPKSLSRRVVSQNGAGEEEGRRESPD